MVAADEYWRQLTEICGFTIPDEYVRLLDDFPEQLRKTPRSPEKTIEEGCVAEVELLAEIAEVVDINIEARKGGVIDPDGEEFLWPEQLLVIGETGTGDYYCIDLSGEHTGVLQYLHQAIEFEIVAESLDDFVGMLLEAYAPNSIDTD